jgi:hypothetical protein
MAHLDKAKYATPMNRLICSSTIWTSMGIGAFFNFSLVMNLIINVMSITPWDFMTWILDCYKILAFPRYYNSAIPPISTRRWIFLWSTCCSYIHDHSLTNKSKRVCIQHGRDTQTFMELFQKLKNDPISYFRSWKLVS